MSNFSAMKKGRKNTLTNLKSKMDSEAKGGASDERFWKLSTDKASNGYAEIRFLQPTDGENFPYIKRFHHAFKVGGKWFWKNCPTTIGGECPVCEANSELWATEIEANKTIVRKRKRQVKYIANILVVNDTAVPENNGKVFLFEFGKKIFEKIMDSMKADPAFPDETEINPFDFWEGANFKLKCREVEGYPNYDKSEFMDISAIAETDKAIEAIWGQQYKVETFIEESEFESYDKLKVAFDKALGNKSKEPETMEEAETPTGFKKPKKTEEPALDDNVKVETDETADAGSDDEMEYYENLLDD